METLERSRVCRLCGKQAGMSIDIFGKRGHHVKKINMVLPILVHEMDLLPKQMCHPCNYKLQEFYQFYEDCLKTDANLKSQLSWMQGSEIREEIIVPMVQINNMKIKSEPFDYEEQGLTGAVLSAANMSNYEQNHYLFADKFLQISHTRCSRCGCFCSNRNYANNQISKNCSTIQEKKTHEMRRITSDAEFHSRDMIRRNLFTTEIFDKNPTLRTVNPLCNETKAFFQEKTVDTLFTGLDQSINQQNAALVTPKMEILEDTSPQITSRVLRPRKRVTTILPKSRSSSDPTKKSNKSSSREIRRNKNEVEVPALLPIIKLEALNECERSLRPRPQPIDYYSKSKRKISQQQIEKIPISMDNVKLENVKKELVTEPEEPPKAMDLETLPRAGSEFVLKVEQEDEPKKVESNKTRKRRFTSRNRRRKTSGIKIKKEIIETEFPDLIATKKNIKLSASQALLFKCSNNKTVDKLKRKNVPKLNNGSTLCLRSQIGCLRNNKLRQFHLFVDEPKKTQKKNISSRSLSSNVIKIKNMEIDGSDEGIISRYQHCSICSKRFASQELYRLHDCYNKRH